MTAPLVSEARIDALAREAIGTPALSPMIYGQIQDAIRTAIEEAGEAAAKVCDELADDIDGDLMGPNTCAAAIRARLGK